MENAPIVQAKLVVAGRDWEPEHCTVATGVAPTRVWSQSRQDLREERELATEAWVVATQKLPTYEIDALVNTVLDHVWSERSALVEFAAEKRLTISVICDVLVTHDRPFLELSPATVRRLAEVNASFGVDLIGIACDDPAED